MDFTLANADDCFRERMNTEAIALNNEIEQKAVSAPAKNVTYKVKKGDQLASLADKYNVTVKDLKRWNHLKSNKIKAGQKLKIKTLG